MLLTFGAYVSAIAEIDYTRNKFPNRYTLKK